MKMNADKRVLPRSMRKHLADIRIKPFVIKAVLKRKAATIVK